MEAEVVPPPPVVLLLLMGERPRRTFKAGRRTGREPVRVKFLFMVLGTLGKVYK